MVITSFSIIQCSRKGTSDQRRATSLLRGHGWKHDGFNGWTGGRYSRALLRSLLRVLTTVSVHSGGWAACYARDQIGAVARIGTVEIVPTRN